MTRILRCDPFPTPEINFNIILNFQATEQPTESCAGRSHFYGSEYEIWAGNGLVGLQKKIGPIMRNFCRQVFLCFYRQKII